MCGQCPPCKLGSGAITGHLECIEAGDGTDRDIAQIIGWLDRLTDGNRCYLAVEEQVLISSILREFADEFAEHIDFGRCPRPRALTTPKLVDLASGIATYDATYSRKRPDWTFEPEPQV